MVGFRFQSPPALWVITRSGGGGVACAVGEHFGSGIASIGGWGVEGGLEWCGMRTVAILVCCLFAVVVNGLVVCLMAGR